MRRRSAVWVLVAGIALLVSPAALAGVEGPCEAKVAGVDMRDRGTGARSEAIPVHETSRPAVSMSANRRISQGKIELELVGFRWTVHDEPVTGRSWSAEIPVDENATWGIGLFKVVATSAGTGFTCTGTALIDVEGTAVATAAGVAGLVLTIAGAVGVLVLIMRGGRAGGQPFAGVFFGSLLGIGIGVLLQQLGVVYPTILVAIVIVVAGALIGFLAGMLGLRPLE